MKNTIKLFFAASVVAFAASCTSKPSEPAAQEETVQEETTPVETEAPADSVDVAADTTATAQ